MTVSNTSENSDLSHSDLDFLRQLENYTFDSKMLICQRYSSRIMSISEVNMDYALKQNIMPWELEAFAAFSVIYNSDNAEQSIDTVAFSEIITKIRNYWHPELRIAEAAGTYPEVFMMVTLLQQAPTQGVFLQKLFRYNYFFTFVDNKIDMRKEFCDKFQVPYLEYMIFAFIVFIYCSHESNVLGTPDDCQKLLQKAFNKKAVFKELSIEMSEYKNQLSALYKNNILDYYFGLKIQYVYPLIIGPDYTYLPSPYLVINAITESMLNRLTFNNPELRKAFGKEVIEQYLYDIYKGISEVTWISKEIPYKIGKQEFKTPDVLVSEDMYCSFYDTKALSPSLKVRQFNQKEINDEIQIYSDCVLQIYERVMDYVKGYFDLDKRYDRDHIFGVVVVLEDAVLPRGKVYSRVYDTYRKKSGDLSQEDMDYIHSHIKVVSLRQIESMLLQNSSFLQCLIDQSERQEHWDDLNFSKPTTDRGLLPLYNDFVVNIKKAVANYLAS